MKAVLNKVTPNDLGHYIMHYTLHYDKQETANSLVFEPISQMLISALAAPRKYNVRLRAVDELDATVNGLQQLRKLYGANNVSLEGNDKVKG